MKRLFTLILVAFTFAFSSVTTVAVSNAVAAPKSASAPVDAADSAIQKDSTDKKVTKKSKKGKKSAKAASKKHKKHKNIGTTSKSKNATPDAVDTTK